MSRRLLALAVAAAALVPVTPASATCVRGVCVNAPHCGSLCLQEILDFQCTDDVQVVCDVRDLIRD